MEYPTATATATVDCEGDPYKDAYELWYQKGLLRWRPAAAVAVGGVHVAVASASAVIVPVDSLLGVLEPNAIRKSESPRPQQTRRHAVVTIPVNQGSVAALAASMNEKSPTKKRAVIALPYPTSNNNSKSTRSSNSSSPTAPTAISTPTPASSSSSLPLLLPITCSTSSSTVSHENDTRTVATTRHVAANKVHLGAYQVWHQQGLVAWKPESSRATAEQQGCSYEHDGATIVTTPVDTTAAVIGNAADHSNETATDTSARAASPCPSTPTLLSVVVPTGEPTTTTVTLESFVDQAVEETATAVAKQKKATETAISATPKVVEKEVPPQADFANSIAAMREVMMTHPEEARVAVSSTPPHRETAESVESKSELLPPLYNDYQAAAATEVFVENYADSSDFEDPSLIAEIQADVDQAGGTGTVLENSSALVEDDSRVLAHEDFEATMAGLVQAIKSHPKEAAIADASLEQDAATISTETESPASDDSLLAAADDRQAQSEHINHVAAALRYIEPEETRVTAVAAPGETSFDSSVALLVETMQSHREEARIAQSIFVEEAGTDSPLSGPIESLAQNDESAAPRSIPHAGNNNVEEAESSDRLPIVPVVPNQCIAEDDPHRSSYRLWNQKGLIKWSPDDMRVPAEPKPEESYQHPHTPVQTTPQAAKRNEEPPVVEEAQSKPFVLSRTMAVEEMVRHIAAEQEPPLHIQPKPSPGLPTPSPQPVSRNIHAAPSPFTTPILVKRVDTAAMAYPQDEVLLDREVKALAQTTTHESRVAVTVTPEKNAIETTTPANFKTSASSLVAAMKSQPEGMKSTKTTTPHQRSVAVTPPTVESHSPEQESYSELHGKGTSDSEAEEATPLTSVPIVHIESIQRIAEDDPHRASYMLWHQKGLLNWSPDGVQRRPASEKRQNHSSAVDRSVSSRLFHDTAKTSATVEYQRGELGKTVIASPEASRRSVASLAAATNERSPAEGARFVEATPLVPAHFDMPPVKTPPKASSLESLSVQDEEMPSVNDTKGVVSPFSSALSPISLATPISKSDPRSDYMLWDQKGFVETSATGGEASTRGGGDESNQQREPMTTGQQSYTNGYKAEVTPKPQQGLEPEMEVYDEAMDRIKMTAASCIEPMNEVNINSLLEENQSSSTGRSDSLPSLGRTESVAASRVHEYFDSKSVEKTITVTSQQQVEVVTSVPKARTLTSRVKKESTRASRVRAYFASQSAEEMPGAAVTSQSKQAGPDAHSKIEKDPMIVPIPMEMKGTIEAAVVPAVKSQSNQERADSAPKSRMLHSPVSATRSNDPKRTVMAIGTAASNQVESNRASSAPRTRAPPIPIKKEAATPSRTNERSRPVRTELVSSSRVQEYYSPRNAENTHTSRVSSASQQTKKKPVTASRLQEYYSSRIMEEIGENQSEFIVPPSPSRIPKVSSPSRTEPISSRVDAFYAAREPVALRTVSSPARTEPISSRVDEYYPARETLALPTLSSPARTEPVPSSRVNAYYASREPVASMEVLQQHSSRGFENAYETTYPSPSRSLAPPSPARTEPMVSTRGEGYYASVATDKLNEAVSAAFPRERVPSNPVRRENFVFLKHTRRKIPRAPAVSYN